MGWLRCRGGNYAGHRPAVAGSSWRAYDVDEAGCGWSIVWVTLSLLFNAVFWWYLAQTQGRAVADPQALAFLTGYLIEKSLAVDNVFVWLMLFSYFSVPPALQRRVLVYGVLGAIGSAYDHDLRRQLAYHPI